MATDIKQKVLYELQVNGVSSAKAGMKGFGDASGKVTDKLKKTTAASSRFSKELKTMALRFISIAAAIAAAKRVVSLFTDSVMGAVEAGESYNKFSVVFGDNAEYINRSLEGLATSTHNSIFGLRELSGGLQDLLVPMMDDRDAAAELSLKFTEVALDLASFQNKDVTAVMTAISSGIRGQSVAVAGLGINMNMAAVNAELLNMGLGVTNLTATQGELVQARYNIIMRDSADALGDAVNTANEAQGALRGVEVAWADGAIEVGEHFIPVIEKLAPKLAELATDVLPATNCVMSNFADATLTASDQLERNEATVKSVISAIVVLTAVETLNLMSAGKLTIATRLLSAAKVKLAIVSKAVGAALTGPAGTAAAITFTALQLYSLTKAINAADDASRQNEEAMSRQSDATRYAGDAIGALIKTQQEGAEVSDVVLNAWIDRLEELDDGSEGVANSLIFLNSQLGTQAQALARESSILDEASASTEGLDYWLRNLSASAREARVARIDLMVTELSAQQVMANGPTLIAAQVAELERYKQQLLDLSSPVAAAPSMVSAPSIPMPTAEALDPFEILGFGNLENVEIAYQEITMVAINEEELKQEAIASIQADWRERYYDTYMDFSGDVVNTFVNSWENGFSDLDDMMKKMIMNWVKQMAASGLLTIFSSAVGGGGVGVFGQLIGAVGGKGK